jgi:drug/metabolite transporter (DMT)-like permease
MGILLAFAAALISAIFLVCMKLMSGGGRNSAVMASGYQLVGGLTLAVSMLFENPRFALDPLALVFLILGFCLWVGSSGIGMAANKYLDASVGIIIMQSSLIVSFVGSVIVYGDKLTWARVIGVVLVIVGNIVIFLRKDLVTAKINIKGVVFRLLASLFFGLAMLCDKHNLENYSISLYTTLTFIIPGVVVGMLAKVPFKQYVKEIYAVKWLTLLTGFLCAVSYFALLQSFKYIDVSVAATINSLNTIFVVIIGVLFLKEKNDLWRKALAVVIVFSGALILNFA